MNKINFDNKLTNFDRRVTSNKAKHLEAPKKLNILMTKYYSFFLGGIYFTSDDGSENMFVYQPNLNVLRLKKDKCIEYIISWKSKGLSNSEIIALQGDFLEIKHFRNK